MIYGNYELSLYLSRNVKIESKIRMECAYSTNAKSSIKVYQFNLKRESIKIKNGKNVKKLGTNRKMTP